MSVRIFYIVLFIAKFLKGVSKNVFLCFWKNYALAYCRLRHVKFGGTQINFIGHTKLFISPLAKVEIGDKFICASGINNGIDNGTYSKICVAPNAFLKIGYQSGLTNSVIQCHEHIEIGNYVNIGAGCMIFDTNFHSTDWRLREDRRADVENAVTKKVVIENYVFIGARSIISKGVTIGEHSIVAVGSVVVKSIPPNEIWGGNPAKFISKINT